jgi:predicted patatin/cPLA2 family phospholipase
MAEFEPPGDPVLPELGATVAERHPVLELLLERRRQGSKPGARRDRFRVGLVVEGGAMRTVVSSGMASALEQLGLRDSFDAVYGASAGASVGAYFAAGGVSAGTAIFFEHANSRAFIDLRRLLIGRPVVNAAFVLDVMRERVPLDFAALRRAGIQLTLVATPLDGPPTAPGSPPRAVAFSDFADLDDLLAALHASSRIPFLGGLAPYVYRGRRYWDAALVEPIPVQTALADGCTHLLTLLTLPAGTPARPLDRLDRLLATYYVRRLSPALEACFRTRYGRRADTCAWLLGPAQASPEPPFLQTIVLPAGSPELGRTELRAAVLRAGARAGAAAVLSAFDLPPAPAAKLLTAIARAGRLTD